MKHLFMTSAALAFAIAATGLGLPALATPDAARQFASKAYPLEDGNTLQVAANGWMRMFSPEGKRVHMRDGVPMKTRDGETILMKEDPNWRQLRQFGTLSPKSR